MVMAREVEVAFVVRRFVKVEVALEVAVRDPAVKFPSDEEAL